MKNKLIGLSIGLIGLVSGACSEKIWPEDAFKKTADSLAGQYEVEDYSWEGPAVDLDGDGCCTKNILDEYEYRPSIRVEEAVYREERNTNERFKIWTSLPFQMVETRDESPFFHMYQTKFYNEYDIQKDGTLLLDEQMKLPYLYENDLHFADRIYEDLKRLGPERLLRQTGYARLEIRLDLCVYDRSRQEWVQAPVTYRFKRSSYL